eukprot:scaffold128228_cov60-Phaeocystis_antarctica.AAC.3
MTTVLNGRSSAAHKYGRSPTQAPTGSPRPSRPQTRPRARGSRREHVGRVAADLKVSGVHLTEQLQRGGVESSHRQTAACLVTRRDGVGGDIGTVGAHQGREVNVERLRMHDNVAVVKGLRQHVTIRAGPSVLRKEDLADRPQLIRAA